MFCVMVSVFFNLVGKLCNVLIMFCLFCVVMLLYLFSVSVSIKKVVNWVVNVLVDVILILVFVFVIKVKFDLWIREEFGML